MCEPARTVACASGPVSAFERGRRAAFFRVTLPALLTESLREAAERRDPDDFEGMLFSLVADLLDMAGSAPRG